MVKAVIFDLDDTLISEKEYIKSGYHHIAKTLTSKIEIPKEIIFYNLMQLFEESAKNVFNRLYEKYGIEYTKETIMCLVNEYREHFPNIKLYDDVLPCLIQLHKAGIKTGIITDGYAVTQRQKLLAINANALFEEIIITDELGREYWKPHPKAFGLMREKLGISFDEMLYIGDNPEKDFYISKKYPIKTCRIIRTDTVHSYKAYYQLIKENIRIRSLIEITDYIYSINEGIGNG